MHEWQHHRTAGIALHTCLPSVIRNHLHGRDNIPGYGNNDKTWLIRNEDLNDLSFLREWREHMVCAQRLMWWWVWRLVNVIVKCQAWYRVQPCSDAAPRIRKLAKSQAWRRNVHISETSSTQGLKHTVIVPVCLLRDTRLVKLQSINAAWQHCQIAGKSFRS